MKVLCVLILCVFACPPFFRLCGKPVTLPIDAAKHEAKIYGKVPKRFQELKKRVDREIAEGDYSQVALRSAGNGRYSIQFMDTEVAVFVLDTSGSMRSPENNLMRGSVLDRVVALLEHMPNLYRAIFVDANGHTILRWEVDRGLYAVDREFGFPFSRVRKSLQLYPFESGSNFYRGVIAASKICSEFQASEKAEIFVVGDEYTGSFWNDWDKYEKKLEGTKVNVMRGHDAMYHLAFELSVLRSTAKKFDKAGKYLAVLTGGRFIEQTVAKHQVSVEAVLISRLAKQHAGMVWRLDQPPEIVANLNEELLSYDPFIDGKTLVPLSDEGSDPDGIGIVKLTVKDRGAHAKRAYVELEGPQGNWAKEYRADLQRTKNGWSIRDWKLLWED